MCSSRTINFAPNAVAAEVTRRTPRQGRSETDSAAPTLSRFTFHVSRFTQYALALVAALLVASAGSVLAQPANDNFSSATPLQGPSGFIQGNNDSATAEVGEPLVPNTTG